jgi:hypothetical protein
MKNVKTSKKTNRLLKRKLPKELKSLVSAYIIGENKGLSVPILDTISKARNLIIVKPAIAATKELPLLFLEWYNINANIPKIKENHLRGESPYRKEDGPSVTIENSGSPSLPQTIPPSSTLTGTVV